jgi:SAM-dependent methyltransferase
VSTCILCSTAVDAHTDLAWRKDGYDIVRCPSCGLVFRAELPPEQALGEIYDEDYFRDRRDGPDRHGYADYLRDEALHRANARRRLGLLAAHTPHPGRILDVGSAAGFFVDEARHAGWDALGVDVSPAMVEWGRSHLGASLICSTFTQSNLPAQPFDAITMWDYIEHSVDPRADLAKARTLLRPGGILALSTGDIGSLVARASGRRWHLLTPEHHNFFFDRTTLGQLLDETGFTVRDARHRGAVYSIAHALYKLSGHGRGHRLRRAVQRLGTSRLGAAGIPLNLFDVVTVAAERR